MTLTFSLTLMTALLGAPTGPLLKDAALYSAPQPAIERAVAPKAESTVGRKAQESATIETGSASALLSKPLFQRGAP